jgi:hypothetical protein
MILATKTEVDEAKRALADKLEDLARAVKRWQWSPDDQVKQSDARNALEQADAAFAEYEETLKAWAAGPDSTAPSTVGQEGR